MDLPNDTPAGSEPVSLSKGAGAAVSGPQGPENPQDGAKKAFGEPFAASAAPTHGSIRGRGGVDLFVATGRILARPFVLLTRRGSAGGPESMASPRGRPTEFGVTTETKPAETGPDHAKKTSSPRKDKRR